MKTAELIDVTLILGSSLGGFWFALARGDFTRGTYFLAFAILCVVLRIDTRGMRRGE